MKTNIEYHTCAFNLKAKILFYYFFFLYSIFSKLRLIFFLFSIESLDLKVFGKAGLH